LPDWQKESWQNFDETSGYVTPEGVSKWPRLHDRQVDDDDDDDFDCDLVLRVEFNVKISQTHA
jgi:hypothetical protein